MKFRNLLSITCIAMLGLSACNNDDEPNFGGLNQNYATFDGAIESMGALKTRASGTTWDSGDAIGVYMKATGADISTSSAINIKYTTPGDGAFTAASTGIELPSDGSNVDFVAYYPYQTTITGQTYPINVSNQSDLTKIDLLYSNNATNTNKTNSAIALNFKHKLSQLILNITAGGGVSSLSGLSLSVSGLTTDGNFSLADATTTLGTTKAVLTPVVSVATAATVNAILIPGDNLNNGKLTFSLNGKVYEWTPDAQVLESGKKYTYSVQLTTTGIVVANPSGTIEDWTEGNTGGSTVILTPNEGDVFTSSKATVSLAATASSDVIQLTTQSTENWTATSSQTWLTISPTNGTGNATITLTAEANTGAARTATITLTPATTSLSPVTISVEQAAASTGADIAFPGSNFEDWSAFLSNLNSYGLLPFGSQSATGGRNGSSALHIAGSTTANEYMFTAVASTSTPVSASKIVLYLKGTATGKSLSFNVYSPDATGGYYKFNLGICNGDANLSSSGANAYTGSIDTGGQWVKVILDITGYNLSTTGNFFALKTGSSATYDLYVDDITFE
ncbi:fimbrillin family protein [Dysgonomonas macrotermitis]|uniref:Putative binding domain-containing protein, N-terminal n=1 Tax=Dysgonomonas macrotermitis TaxID=1346286 RepID=A0A1M4W9J8_9BACT|nr:fimbrillin family protein [Dysgonomonas macrotermitis]SHE77906.1 Putative binding domain-containing protein, N-terminal [Dysgonomonas macrotermitis]